MMSHYRKQATTDTPASVRKSKLQTDAFEEEDNCVRSSPLPQIHHKRRSHSPCRSSPKVAQQQTLDGMLQLSRTEANVSRGHRRSSNAGQPRGMSKTQQRQQAFTTELRAAVVEMAFDILDPRMTCKVDGKLLDMIRDELANLIRKNTTEEKRENQRFIAEMGQKYVNRVRKEEKRAFERSVNLSKIKDTAVSEDSEEPDSEDCKFVATDDESEVEPTHHRRRKSEHRDKKKKTRPTTEEAELQIDNTATNQEEEEAELQIDNTATNQKEDEGDAEEDSVEGEPDSDAIEAVRRRQRSRQAEFEAAERQERSEPQKELSAKEKYLEVTSKSLARKRPRRRIVLADEDGMANGEDEQEEHHTSRHRASLTNEEEAIANDEHSDFQ